MSIIIKVLTANNCWYFLYILTIKLKEIRYQNMEQSKLWRSTVFSGIELLSATFTDFQFKKHWHDELAIGMIEAGAEKVWYRGKNLLVPQQHIIAINSGEIHTGLSGTDYGWRYRMFYFDLAYISVLLKDSFLSVNSIINQPIIYDPVLYYKLLQLHHALELSSFTLTKDTLLTIALEKLFTKYGSTQTYETTKHIDIKSAVIAREFIIEHWQYNPSLSQLEQVIDCNRFQLLRSFKAMFGITPHQFLLLIKTQKAKELLSDGISYLDVSLFCGFYDQSHFNRNFKKVYGISPSN